MSASVYFSLTKNCNLECAHCFQEAGPGKPSMSVEDVKTVLGNVRGRPNYITFTGGEVFTKKDLLYEAIATAKELWPLGTAINLQTNGFWARNEQVVNQTLDELIDLDIFNMEVTSNSRFHRDAGLDNSRTELLGKMLKKRHLGSLKSLSWGKYFPIGRAKDLHPENWGVYTNFNCTNFIDGTLNIDYQGNLYPCCFMVPGTDIGNIMETNSEEIFQKASKNDNVKILTSFNRNNPGPARLAQMLGMEERFELNKYGDCNICIEIFRRGLASLKDD